MSENYGKDLEKMLDLDGNLRDQSEYVKKMIEPLLTWEWAYNNEIEVAGLYTGSDDYKDYWEEKNKKDPNYVKNYLLSLSVHSLYDRLAYDIDRKSAVEKLKSLGIEGERHNDRVDHVFDDDYIKSLDPEEYKRTAMDEYFREELKKDIVHNCKMISKISDERANVYIDSYHSTFGDEGLSYLYEKSRNLVINTNYGEDVLEGVVPSEVQSDINTLFRKLERINNKDIFDEYELIEFEKKNIADFIQSKKSQEYKENGMENQFDWENNILKTPLGLKRKEPFCFKVTQNSEYASIGFYEDENVDSPIYLINTKSDVDTAKKLVEDTIEFLTNKKQFAYSDILKCLDTLKYKAEQPPVSDRQLETAQKTGYVQGVCESVLAFNTDENRKIMSEATMSFLSKKLLSEMNVTKDMAQKFANPETYKALEQRVFAPAQEQRLEQTQGVKR